MHPSTWPIPAIIALFAASALAAMLLAPRLLTRLRGRPVSLATHAANFDVFKILGQLTGIFLLFLLTQSMTYFRDAEIATAREAGDILQLDRALATLDPPNSTDVSAAARARLQHYVRTIIEQEWPAMARSTLSPATDTALARLRASIADALGPTAAEPAARTASRPASRLVQKDLDDIEDDRTARGGAATSGLHRALWSVVAGMSLLLTAMLAVMNANDAQFRALLCYVVGIALLASLLFMVEGPYHGEFSVGPQPLQRALAAMTRPP